jgi:hypothetical protein
MISSNPIVRPLIFEFCFRERGEILSQYVALLVFGLRLLPRIQFRRRQNLGLKVCRLKLFDSFLYDTSASNYHRVY